MLNDVFSDRGTETGKPSEKKTRDTMTGWYAEGPTGVTSGGDGRIRSSRASQGRARRRKAVQGQKAGDDRSIDEPGERAVSGAVAAPMTTRPSGGSEAAGTGATAASGLSGDEQ
jgi:hypothetical protein